MQAGPTIPQLIADLKRAFPRERIETATIAVYARELADLDPLELDGAVREIIRGSRYFPTVSEIRERYADRALSLPGEADALAQAERYAYAERRVVACPHDDYELAVNCPRCRGTGDEYVVDVAIHPLVREALNLVGGRYGYKNADEPSVVRGQFLRLYRSLRERTIRERAVGDVAALPPGVPRLELPAP